MPPAVPTIRLLRQRVLDGTDPGTPLLPASARPPASFPVTASGDTSLPPASETCQHRDLALTPPHRTSTGSQVRQNGPTEVEAPSTPGQPAPAVPTHLPPWASVPL